MKNYMLLTTLRISLLAFFTKVILEISIELSNIMNLRVKAHFLGDFTRSAHYIWCDFVVHFWLYIFFCIIVFLILNYTKVSKKLLLLFTLLLIMIVLLHRHNFQFPIKEYYFPSQTDFNFKLIEEFLIYSASGFLTIFLIRNRKNNFIE